MYRKLGKYVTVCGKSCINVASLNFLGMSGRNDIEVRRNTRIICCALGLLNYDYFGTKFQITFSDYWWLLLLFWLYADAYSVEDLGRNDVHTASHMWLCQNSNCLMVVHTDSSNVIAVTLLVWGQHQWRIFMFTMAETLYSSLCNLKITLYLSGILYILTAF